MQNVTISKHHSTVVSLLIMVGALMVNTLAHSESSPNSSVEVNHSIQNTLSSVGDKRTQWFTYQVAMEPNNGMPCCWVKGKRSQCALEEPVTSWSSSSGSQGESQSDSKMLSIYLEQQQAKVTQILLVGSECKIEKGALTVTELLNVGAPQSIEFLQSLALQPTRDMRHMAMAAIALHQGSEAHNALQAFSQSDNKELRREAIFWFGQARNQAGYESLLSIVDDAKVGSELRQHSVFSMSLNSDERAVEKLAALATKNANATIQSEALFWLAQQHPGRAPQVIGDVLASNSSTQIKTKAVFALSELDTDWSWNQLINLAQTNAQAKVQAEAIFWLSQHEQRNPVSVLSEIATGDYSRSIKKRAVFALAQLPSARATPALIAVSQQSDEKAIIREAVFWLGQSDDPNALAHLEAMLTASGY